MTNLLNINSVNIKSFGFNTLFDLAAKNITFDISGLTVFNSGGAGNVVGIAFEVIDPSGVPIASIDWTQPSINPNSATTFVVPITSGISAFGWYKITGVIREADNTDFPIILRKEICQPEGYLQQGYVPAAFDILANCDIPMITITEKTKLIYNGASPVNTVKSGVLSYPKGTLSDLAITFTPFIVGGSGKVYTGRYTLNNTTTGTYDLQDGVSINITYKAVNIESVVNCTSAISKLICCISDLNETYLADPYSVTGKDIKQKLDRITLPFMMATIKEKAGQDNSDEVEIISKITGCDCNCGIDNVEPMPVLTGGVQISSFAIAGLNAASASSATSGGTTTWSINVKNILVTNFDSDPAFTINKIITGTAITYAISFNYALLAEALLTTIQNNDDLLELLRNLVAATGSGLTLDGLDSSCIITLDECTYTLIEQNNGPKTVVSVVVNGTVHNAPNGTLLSNVTAVRNWLNSLTLGTFTVSLDSGPNNIIINTNGNPNVFTVLNLNTTAGPLIRDFTKTCSGLADVLNAIMEYVCALDGSKVAFGLNGLKQSTYNNDFTINKIAISPIKTLQGLLYDIINAENALYDRLNTVGLTCTNVKALFIHQDLTRVATDGVYGTIGDACAKITFDELVAIMFEKMAANPDLQSQLCGLTAGCAGAVCAPVTNVSATLTSGSLIVNCNDAGAGATPVQIRYRVNNSGATFIEVDCTAADLPKSVGSSLTTAQYEVQVRVQCSNGVFSPWASAVTANTCAQPVAFGVSVSGTNFVIAATLSGSQTKILVQMTDPNGGITSIPIHDFGAVSGTFNYAIPNTTLYGNYQFSARAVCDSTASPVFASDPTNPSVVAYANPTSNNVRATAGYGMTITDIVGGTASIVPAVFHNLTITGVAYGYSPSLGNGTITVVLTGSVPMGISPTLNLLKNYTELRSSQAITGAGTYTLTNAGGVIAFPDLWSIEINI